MIHFNDQIVEYDLIEKNGEFFIRVTIDREHSDIVAGPYDTKELATEIYDDLLEMMRQQGAIDVPKVQ